MQESLAASKARKAGRVPQQGRSQERMGRVLAAAEQLLGEIGPEATSIPEISKRSGVPRASIYQFFPDKYVLFAHLAATHMERLGELIAEGLREQADDWKSLIYAVIRRAADYYSTYPVASILLMRGNFSSADREAHERKDAMIGQLLREYVVGQGELVALPEQPDVATLAVEIAFACLKHGYAVEGRISEAICQEAQQATVGYLSRWVTPLQPCPEI